MAEQDARQSGIDAYADEAGDPQAEGGEGRRNADATPAIGDSGGHGQTTTPAAGDVGVPSDEELDAQTEAADPDATGEQREPTLPGESA